MSAATYPDYTFCDEAAEPTRSYLWPVLFRELDKLALPTGCRVFDLGCGNGALARSLAEKGWRVAGVDPSESGIAVARTANPALDLRRASSDDDLSAMFGDFSVVVSLEVVEHVYAPSRYARCLFDLLEPGGVALVSTPYHGYWKNLALAATGRLDAHFTALWDGGHIKFWSPNSLTTLLHQAGLQVEKIIRVGRIPPLAKSMLAVARRPMGDSLK